MSTSAIKITRYPYEEPYHLNLRIEAGNGHFRGELEYYCNSEDLGRLGRKRAGYSGQRVDEIAYLLGSEKPEDRCAFFLKVQVKALDSTGHCALLIRMNTNDEFPEAGVAEFSIRAEVADINRLGDLLIGFGRLKHRTLEWQVKDGWLSGDQS